MPKSRATQSPLVEQVEPILNWYNLLRKIPKIFLEDSYMSKESNKRNDTQFWARTSENQTKKDQVFLMTDKVSQP